ncbi:MAG: SusD/RagB family nutrient-binding outer membrane lipoprotein [Tannerellaceae bacterium]|jgi:hypothetical protein|nr:SusD/RagB family nutrient-binding outer membrane lipoprotein [Tannerellaceae bacterium]
MKKIIILLAASAVLLTFSACSEDDFTSKFVDPSKVTVAPTDKLFTGVLEKAGEFLRIGYGRFMLHDQGVGKLSQAWGVRPDDELYNDGLYMYSAWGWYTSTVTQYKQLKIAYETGGDETMKVYELCGRAVMYQAMLQALDEFGKLPYTDVGGFFETGEVWNDVHLEDTESLYELILDDLDKINDELPSMTMPISSMNDWLNDGNMDKWRVYVNSLRLRAAIRLTGAEDYTNPDNTLAGKAKTVVTTMLGNPGKYPVVSSTADQISVKWHGSGNGWWNTITGFDNYGQWHSRNTASNARILRLDLDGDSLYNPEFDDPRLPLLYDAVQDGRNKGKYVGINLRHNLSDIAADVSGANDGGVKQYSFVNERSFRDNRKMDSYVITPSEIAFYKAEAILRFGVGGDAKAEFVRGVRESVNMYAKINAESDAADPSASRSPAVEMSYWTDAKVTEFAERIWDNQPNKLKAVYEQFWLHCGIFNSTETWNVLRRTGYPEGLYYPYVSGYNCPVLPQRFIVPNDEYQRSPETLPNEANNGQYTRGQSYWEVLFWAREIVGDTAPK